MKKFSVILLFIALISCKTTKIDKVTGKQVLTANTKHILKTQPNGFYYKFKKHIPEIAKTK